MQIFILKVDACYRVDFTIPGIDVVGGYSMCSSPQLLQKERLMELSVKYSSHPPAYWIHKQVIVLNIS